MGPWLLRSGLALIGFKAAGVAACSLASTIQKIIGNVVKGSLFV